MMNDEKHEMADRVLKAVHEAVKAISDASHDPSEMLTTSASVSAVIIWATVKEDRYDAALERMSDSISGFLEFYEKFGIQAMEQ